MSSRRRAILHLGGEKTGSTTLQRTLAANRPALAAEGILYSAAAGTDNHVLLALHATEGQGTADLRAMAGLSDAAAFAAFLHDFPDRLRAEADASDAHLVIYSNEHLSSRLRNAAAVERVRALLAPVAAEVRVVYYARPQQELVLAGWSTMLKSGSAERFALDRLLHHGTLLDHAALVERWAAAFPDPCWILRPYQRAALAGGDIVEDFLAAAGLPAAAVPRRLPALNRSLDAARAEFLRLYNAASQGQPAPSRGLLIRMLEHLSDGPSLTLAPGEAAAVAARFAAGNAAVARRLLGRDTLFHPVPPAPEAGVPPGLTTEDAVRIAAILWRVAQERPPPA